MVCFKKESIDKWGYAISKKKLKKKKLILWPFDAGFDTWFANSPLLNLYSGTPVRGRLKELTRFLCR